MTLGGAQGEVQVFLTIENARWRQARTSAFPHESVYSEMPQVDAARAAATVIRAAEEGRAGTVRVANGAPRSASGRSARKR